MSLSKLNKISKLHTAAHEKAEGEEDRKPASESEPKKPGKRSKKLDFNENMGGLHTTIYKDKE